MDELTKIKISNLISLRQSLLTLLPILIGGTIGVCFINEGFIFKNMLIVAGVFFSIVLIISPYKTIVELNAYLYKQNERGKNGHI